MVATATPMTPEQEQGLKSHLKAIAQILYDESDPEAMKTCLRDRIDCAAANPDACEPRIREFFIQTVTRTQAGKRRRLKSTLGEIEITTRQAQKLGVQSYRRLSPHLENCCLRLSANVSYAQAEQDIAYLVGIRIPAKTQQRLVHRQTFPLQHRR